MTETHWTLLQVLNVWFYGGIAWIMFCRARLMNEQYSWWVSIAVALLGTVSMACAVAPILGLWGQSVSVLNVCFGGGVLIYQLIVMPAWVNSKSDFPPRYLRGAPRCR